MGKKYRTERRRIDARQVHTVLHDADAVDYYKKHPGGSYGFWGNGGRPSVGRGRGGKLVAWEGNHRIAAAAAQGRKIDVDFQVEVGSDEGAGSGGFFDWLFR
jgi:hypothetical protein